MKSEPKIRRVKLDISGSNEPVIYGIVASEPDYKLSLALNRKLGISLKNTAPVILQEENDNELLFSRFSDSSNSSGLVYDLTSNRSGKSCLIRKMKNIDYFFQIHDIDNEPDAGWILSLLRETDCITAVFNITTDIIKDRNLKYLIR